MKVTPVAVGKGYRDPVMLHSSQETVRDGRVHRWTAVAVGQGYRDPLQQAMLHLSQETMCDVPVL